MKQSRLVFATVVVAALCAWSLVAFACDKGKTSASAAASNGTCTAAMAAKCTPEMAAACKAKGASATTAAMNGECPYASSAAAKGACPHGTSATTASMSGSCSMHGTSATTASATGSCAAHGASATTASMDAGCCASGAKSTSATSATMSGAKGTTMVAGASGSCSAHGSATAAAGTMAAGSSCGAHGATAKSARMADCDACADMAMCADDAKSLGANVSIVPLKNGVMFVYTAEQPGRVQAVQAEMTRRSDHIAQVLAAGDKAKLCPDCKLLRGAIASGKLSRELVNIEGGCLTLMTSTDPAMVAKLHTMAGVKGQSRLAKS